MRKCIYRVAWKKRPKEFPCISLPTSKSELNRLLVLAALREGETHILGENRCDDVVKMVTALQVLGFSVAESSRGYLVTKGGLHNLHRTRKKISLDCGAGGTTLRFLMAMAAIRPGPTELNMSSQLLARPQKQWIETLRGFGVEIQKTDKNLLVKGKPRWPSRIEIASDQSSQFASAVCLVTSAFEHPTDIIRKGTPVSEPYWIMTLECIKKVGAGSEDIRDGVRICPPSAERRNQTVSLETEGDASSAAVWLAAGSLGWPVILKNYPTSMRQADRKFLQILPELGGRVKEKNDGIYVLPSSGRQHNRIVNLRDAPDLSPVVSVLSSLLPGSTRIVGAEHLRFKESNRIEELVEAFSSVGITIQPRADGLEIVGSQTPIDGTIKPFGDHRLAMAATLFASRAKEVTVLDAEVVSKSYPKFWEHAEKVGWIVERKIEEVTF